VRDGVALADQVLARMGDAEELVGEGARAGVGRAGQDVLLLRVVQRVIEPRDVRAALRNAGWVVTSLTRSP
jgi:hypothetical protein